MFFKLTRILLILSAIMLGGACSSDDPGTPHAEKHRAKILKYLHLKPDEKIADICFYSTETLKKREYYFAFTAPREVIGLILQTHPFRKMETNHDADHAFVRIFPWWDAGIREKSEYYAWREYQGEYLRTHYQIWYHPKTEKCLISLHYFYVPQKGWLKYYRFLKYDANRQPTPKQESLYPKKS